MVKDDKIKRMKLDKLFEKVPFSFLKKKRVNQQSLILLVCVVLGAIEKK